MQTDRSTIPRFFLYGEAAASAGERFVHIESVERRSRPHNWTIRPHAHADLHHVFLIRSGRGEMQACGRRFAFEGPALLLVPAGEVHGFRFEAETGGHVVTFVEHLLRHYGRREPALEALFADAGCLALTADLIERLELDRLPREIERELDAAEPAREMAVEALLLRLLVGVVRLARLPAGPALAPGPRAALVARFRALVDREFRSGWPVTRYAGALGVTPGRLRAACIEITGRPSIELLHDRLILEAKRNLTYTDMTVAEVAYDLGFDDPAYFSRFFTGRTGLTPSRYRQGERTAEMSKNSPPSSMARGGSPA